MERLKGIGVSPGVAVGPALVAIQRTQVIRFPIAVDRVTRSGLPSPLTSRTVTLRGREPVAKTWRGPKLGVVEPGRVEFSSTDTVSAM